MKSITILFTTIIFSITAFCQTEIKLEEIGKRIGESVKVCTKIYGGIYLERSKGTPTFLNAGGSYPNNPLTLVIWSDVRKEFADKPEEFFKDKMVCIFGKVELFKDKPQIVIQSKSQIILQQ